MVALTKILAKRSGVKPECRPTHGLLICQHNGTIEINTSKATIPFKRLGKTQTVMVKASSVEAAAKGLDKAAEASGGNVSVKGIESAPDGGVLIAIELPDQAAEAAKNAIATEPGVTIQPGGGTGTVQFVDSFGNPITSFDMGTVSIFSSVTLGLRNGSGSQITLQSADTGSREIAASLSGMIGTLLATINPGETRAFKLDITRSATPGAKMVTLAVTHQDNLGVLRTINLPITANVV